ncbi:MAG: hypothetical protein MJZ69_03480 [Bacteroidaceae bacterium]|nr:hypothetical protein [Bacteroidaceae bacterium]
MKRNTILIILFLFSTSVFSQNAVIKRQSSTTTRVGTTNRRTNHSSTKSMSLYTEGGIKIECSKEVSLGLPSGTIWAGWNIGANTPDGKGGWFGWGYSSDVFHSKDYIQNIDSMSIIGTEHDAATMQWGKKWCMPSQAQFFELLVNTERKIDKFRGISGTVLTSKINGKSIFFPSNGFVSFFINANYIHDLGDRGIYLTGEKPVNVFHVYQFSYDNYDSNATNGYGILGCSLRAVVNNNPKINEFDFYFDYGMVCSAKKNNKEALYCFEKAYTMIDDDIALEDKKALLNNYAWFLSTNNIQTSKALELCEKAILIAPDDPSLLDTYAYALYLAKRYDEASVYIDEAISLSKGDVSEELLEHKKLIKKQINKL